jgi:penicillin-binding protein 1B
VFKPFVYASVLNLALDGGQVVTPLTQVDDEPRIFEYDGKEYAPNNFKQQFNGRVTLRQALAKSLNIPTVQFAEIAGYDKVADLARRAGLTGVRGTPSAALGSYEATPLEIAGAYTVFSNGGVSVQTMLVKEVRSAENSLIYKPRATQSAVLDPRISFMVLSLMQDVINSGTAAGARSRGFLQPAAGKTGTSHDAWFAGFTSNLLCVVWVGFDDNQELPLEGGKAALPIWTEFMKRAHARRQYRSVTPFKEPDGITFVEVCPLSGGRATDRCHGTKTEVFLAGTEPGEMCPIHPGSSRTQIAKWDEESPQSPAETVVSAGTPRVAKASRARAPQAESQARVQQTQTQRKEPEKKGALKSFWDFIRGKS